MKLTEQILLLNNLKEDTKNLWGKMTPQHMIEHLILSLQISNNKLATSCFTPEEKLPTLKKVLMSERPFPKGFVNALTGDGLPELTYSDLSKAKSVLEQETKDFYLYFEKYPDAKLINPTFGELNKEEWEQFHKKHFTHHLSQFGLV